MSYLDRYVAEDPAAVWQELVDQGERVRAPALASDAAAVAHEAMSRVSRNLQRVVSRLDALGYAFFDRAAALAPVDHEIEALIGRFEAEIGPLPLALQAFYRVVGGVDWRGEMPRWSRPGPLRPDSPLNAVVEESRCYTDPLMVPPLRALFEECAARHDELARLEADEGLIVTFSPDFLGKHEAQGGLYGVLLPDPGLDTDLDAFDATTFTDYLRDALRWGGFPGLTHYRTPDVTTIESLRAEHEPF